MQRGRRSGQVVLAALVAVCAALPAFAGEVAFVKDYTYQASEVDSKVSSRAIALEQVKRLLLEQVGTYVRSETTVREFQLAADEVVTLTAGIVSVEVLKEEWDGKQYALTARVAVDPQQVAEAIDELRGNAVDRAELEASRKQNAETLREIERLRREMETLRQEAKRSAETVSALQRERKNQPEQAPAAAEQAVRLERLEEQYATSTGSLDRNNLLEQARSLRDQGDLESALEKFDKAVKADPRDTRAYLGRAGTYLRMDKASQAFRDVDQVLVIDPRSAMAYMMRGKILRKQGQCGKAIKEQNKALRELPEFAEAYFERGLCTVKRGEKRQGIDDLKRAANMGLRKAQTALRDRGIIY